MLNVILWEMVICVHAASVYTDDTDKTSTSFYSSLISTVIKLVSGTE